jgi:hypothetical protein
VRGCFAPEFNGSAPRRAGHRPGRRRADLAQRLDYALDVAQVERDRVDDLTLTWIVASRAIAPAPRPRSRAQERQSLNLGWSEFQCSERSGQFGA